MLVRVRRQHRRLRLLTRRRVAVLMARPVRVAVIVILLTGCQFVLMRVAQRRSADSAIIMMTSAPYKLTTGEMHAGILTLHNTL